MPTNASFTSPKKKPSVFWYVGAAVSVLVLVFLFQSFGPKQRIVVSPQTTFITQPLAADGLPDYEKYLLELYREGLTLENNAAVPLLKAIFSSGFDPNDVQAIVTELRMKEAPSASDALKPVHCEENQAALWQWLAGRWANQKNLSDVDAWAERMIDQAVWRPWTSQEMPPLAKWLAENKGPLDLIVEASRRPRYIMPSPTLLNEKRDLLVDMRSPKGQGLCQACRSLLARAMWHLGEGRPKDAWLDVYALYRLSGLLSQGLMPIEQSKARDVNALACYATATLLHHGDLTVDQAREIHRDLTGLPPLSGVEGSLDVRQRLFAVDAIVYAGARDDPDQLGRLVEEISIVVGSLKRNSIDWNIVLRETNRGYDRLITSAHVKDREARSRAMNEIERDLRDRLAGRVSDANGIGAGATSRHDRSEFLANLILSALLSSFERGIAFEDRANATRELTCVAAALAIHRTEHDRYPEKLSDLVPGVLKELPRDRFHAKPYIYQRDGDGYLLYSTGENGVDDGGGNVQTYFLESPPFDDRGRIGHDPMVPQGQISPGADDIAIRVPRPPFQWPKAAALAK